MPSILLLSLASHQVDLNLKIPGRDLNIVEGKITLGIHDAVSVRRDDERAFLHSLAEHPPDVTLRERAEVFKNKTQKIFPPSVFLTITEVNGFQYSRA